MIRFLQPADAMRSYAEAQKNRALGDFVNEILRSVNAQAFMEWREIDLRFLERRTGLERERLVRGLGFLQERGLIGWRPPGDAVTLELLEHRARKLPIDDASVRSARKRAEWRLAEMLRYARSITCRRHFLLAYFGEPSPERCGKCDVCLGRHRPKVISPDEEPVLRGILEAVREGLPREEWLSWESSSDREIEGLLVWLVQEGYLHATDPIEDRFELTERGRAFLQRQRDSGSHG